MASDKSDDITDEEIKRITEKIMNRTQKGEESTRKAEEQVQENEISWELAPHSPAEHVDKQSSILFGFKWYCKNCGEILGSTKNDVEGLDGCPNCGNKSAEMLDAEELWRAEEERKAEAAKKEVEEEDSPEEVEKEDSPEEVEEETKQSLDLNQSTAKYSNLNNVRIAYMFIGYSTLLLAAYGVFFGGVNIFLGGMIVVVGVIILSISEILKLFMDLQDNTYQSTELNLVMAESLDSINKNIKQIVELVKKK